jgi:hypothetical protein
LKNLSGNRNGKFFSAWNERNKRLKITVSGARFQNSRQKSQGKSTAKWEVNTAISLQKNKFL